MTADDHYLNPVYGHSFPDPFILKFRGEYFSYSTGLARDGNVFQVIRSTDVVNWHELGGAMVRLETDDPFYWAPEVTYYNGKFYLYYSVGNETLMHLRVAVADKPEGPFVDSGHRLTKQEFAIDAHVFRDDDGRWFMFYATDFLTHTHIGTGTVVDQMIDPFTLAGEPRPVTRAKHDWQVYDPARREKGGARWHTVEGPTVLKRKGLYFEMFSGGNWQNVSYGVSYAVTDDIDADKEWHQHSDGITTLPILRTIPDRVIGPGHNSVIRGPNNRELYCVYHRWVGDERVLAIDRMDFSGGDTMIITGPTYTPQPRPYAPHVVDNFDGGVSNGWQVLNGDWTCENNELRPASPVGNEIRHSVTSESFLAELYLRSDGDKPFGVKIELTGSDALSFLIDPVAGQAVVSGSSAPRNFSLPDSFLPGAFHHLRVEVDHRWASIALDDADVMFTTGLGSAVEGVVLTAADDHASFSAFSLTYGFEELFADDKIARRGWKVDDAEAISFEQRDLLVDREGGNKARLSKPVPSVDHELAVNLCPVRFGPKGSIAIRAGYAITITATGTLDLAVGDSRIVLSNDYGLGHYRQLRAVRRPGTLDLYLDGRHLITTPAIDHQTEIELEVVDAVVAIDMVRFTLL